MNGSTFDEYRHSLMVEWQEYTDSVRRRVRAGSQLEAFRWAFSAGFDYGRAHPGEIVTDADDQNHATDREGQGEGERGEPRSAARHE
jgi:hypothetical protein